MIDTNQHIIEVTAYDNAQMDSLLRVQDGKMDTILRDLSFIMTNGTDYTPEIKEFAIPLIIGIFTIMGSLIFAIISRIDSKYSAKGFINLYWNHWIIRSFMFCFVVCLIAIAVYAIFRKHTSPIGWSISLYLLAILLFVSAVLVFVRALRFNNPQKLLSEIFTHFNAGLCSEEEQAEFYSLCTQLAHYAIVCDITLLHDLIKRYVEDHIRKVPEFSEKLYNSIIDIAADYKEKEDDPEVNAVLAYLFASMVDFSQEGDTKQDTYNALFHTLYICNRNKHYFLINRFQLIMRYAFYKITKDSQINKNERVNRLRLFVMAFNGLLYGKGSIECVEDAVKNNYDAVIIGDATIIPQTSNQCFDLYCFLREVLMAGREYEYYYFVTSDFTSHTDSTLLNRYFAGYFGYLISKLHQNQLLPEDLMLSATIRESNIRHSFVVLSKMAPDDATRAYIENLQASYWIRRAEIIDNTEINKNLCETIIAKQINDKHIFDVTLKGIVTNNSIYMRNATDSYHPVMELKSIQRECLIEPNINSTANFFEKIDFGSKVIECIRDALADVYNSFEREEETIRIKDLNSRWLEYVTKYDYKFLTFRVNGVPGKVIPSGDRFAHYFPTPSIIVIRVPDLPYIEWSNDCQVLPIEEQGAEENTSLLVNIMVDLHMNIHYNKKTIIHVLKVTD